jgi:hypothetical protein
MQTSAATGEQALAALGQAGWLYAVTHKTFGLVLTSGLSDALR